MNMKKSLLFIFVLATVISWQIAKAENLFTKNLYFGIQKDSEVTKLQEFLTSEGVYSGPITGNFFSLTLKAVKDYQTREGISPAAGYFGPISRAKANTGLSTQIEASNAQAVSETGSTPTSPNTPKTTTDVVNTMQSQLDALLQQVALLQQQLQVQQQTNQSIQNLQTQVVEQTQVIQQQQETLGAIQQNTTPTPTPTPVYVAPVVLTPLPKVLVAAIVYNGNANYYQTTSYTTTVGSMVVVNVFVKQGDDYVLDPKLPELDISVSATDQSQVSGRLHFTYSTPQLFIDGKQLTWSKSARFGYTPNTKGIHTLTFHSDTLNSTTSVDIIVQPTPPSSLSLQLVSGSGGSPSANQVVSVGTTGLSVLAFKIIPTGEPQKITSLKITAVSTGDGGLTLATLRDIRLYNGGAFFASAPQFDICNINSCTVAFTAGDNLLSAPVPITGVTIYVSASISPASSGAILGNNFKFMIASPGDVIAKGAITGSAPTTITGTPTASGISYIVSQNVKIEATSINTTIGTNTGQPVATFKVVNNGASSVYLDKLQFANSGSAAATVGFRIYASTQGGRGDTSGWNNGNGYAAINGTTGASSVIGFDTTAFTDAERRIDGGSWRYLTIKTTGSATNNDTFQFSVSALGNILYSVKESDLGYDGNGNGTLFDTIYGLYADGIPSLLTVTAKN